jgi:uncharacterized protein (UPF0254 family)
VEAEPEQAANAIATAANEVIRSDMRIGRGSSSVAAPGRGAIAIQTKLQPVLFMPVLFMRERQGADAAVRMRWPCGSIS